MTGRPLNQVIHCLRHITLLQDGGGPSDGQLLECFLARRDDEAFAALVRRHGPMVLGVCRRVLGNCHDAEDAFQVAFLVLARRAAAVVPREAVGNFLYGVAYRTALKAKATAARRRKREKQVTNMPHPTVEVAVEDVWQELQPLLDEELHRLPDIYRWPVVLCDLEGRSRKDAARQLGVPEGTLSSRLATARKRLAEGLKQRGVTVSAGALALVLVRSASACVPVSLMRSTVQAATVIAAGEAVTAGVISPQVAALLEGVSKAMWMTKLKLATVLLLAVIVSTVGTGLLRHQALAEAQGEQRAERPKPARPKDALQPGQLTPAQYVESQVWALIKADAEKHTVSLKLFRWIGQYKGVYAQLDKVDEPLVKPLGILKLQDYAVDKDVKVSIDGKPGQFKDLKSEMCVVLRLLPGKAAIARIDATSPENAILKATDVEKNTITVKTGGQEVTLPLSVEAKVTRDGWPAPGAAFQFTDLKPGMRLDLVLGVEGDQIVVREIKAGY